MPTPTRIIVDLSAGTTTEIELAGDELAAYEASLAKQMLEQVTVSNQTQLSGTSPT